MEKQTLPNSTLVLILGILSILTCCCVGIPGLILGIVALVLAKQARETYLVNPELYTGYSNVKTGKILAIVGIVISSIYVIYVLGVLIFYGGMDGLMEMQDEMLRSIETSERD